MGLLDGKVVLITGAGRAQGRAHAVVSAREGADVIVTDIDADIATVPYGLGTKEDLAETVSLVEKQGRRAISAIVDVRSQQALDDAVARGIAEFGKIDALIANAGIVSLGLVHELTDEQWQDMLDVNLTGVWRSVKAVLPHMIERHSGSIVMTSSTNGVDAAELHSHYTTTKHGVLGLMKSVGIEGAKHGIRCNAIKPGAIRSAMVEFPAMLDMFAGHEGQGTLDHVDPAGYYYNALPFGMLDPEVCANTAAYLNSDLASVVTGAEIPVDAGHALLPRLNMNPVRPGE